MKRRRLEVYRARDGWRWRVRASNGKVIAESGEAYTRRAACWQSAYSLFLIGPPPLLGSGAAR